MNKDDVVSSRGTTQISVHDLWNVELGVVVVAVFALVCPCLPLLVVVTKGYTPMSP